MGTIKPIVEIKPEPSRGEPLHEHPLLDRIYRNRGVKTMAEVEYSLARLLPPMSLKGMDAAVEIITKHILRGNRILIIGDFDCDGATATTTMVEGISLCGGKDVRFLVPDRMVHGYGLTPEIVQLAAELEPDLIITVDNGISSVEGAKAVKALPRPTDLIITDHHLPPAGGVLPDCDAIVNPQQAGCDFESKAICGCGVAFYVILALRAYMREQGLFERLGVPEPKVGRLLDVVALGTVADVVPLDYNNRILVDAGLQLINRGYARPGIAALLDVSNKEVGRITAADFGFAIGPRINAAGRLDDMSLGIRCLLATSRTEAYALAQQLDDINIQRKEMTAEMADEASKIADQLSSSRHAVCVYDPNWHEGIVGIVAGRLKERLNRPTICFTDTTKTRELKEALAEETNPARLAELEKQISEEGEIKGSARSVPGVHFKHVLDSINKHHPEILTKFGGHAMAAGVTIRSSKLEEFQDLLDAEVRKILTEEMIRGKLEVDVYPMPDAWMTLDAAELIRGAGPWGQHFPEPIFAADFEILESRVLKDRHLKMMVRQPGGEKVYEAIAFNCVEDGVLPVGDTMQATFKLDVNTFRGETRLQLLIEHLQDPELALKKSPPEKAEVPEQRTLPGAASLNKRKRKPQEPENSIVNNGAPTFDF